MPLFAVWEFVVGDDWRTAVGVALALALTALIADGGISAWWVTPLAVFGLLELSIRRAADAPRVAPHGKAKDELTPGV